jgi:NitT/TauT family transport system substrate-binding protein
MAVTDEGADEMILNRTSHWKAALAALGLLAAFAAPALAEAKKDFKVCWSIYVGWMPWGYIQDSGITKKWADKYGINVEVVQINDYVESINQYTSGQYDGCAMTNMDALSIPPPARSTPRR